MKFKNLVGAVVLFTALQAAAVVSAAPVVVNGGFEADTNTGATPPTGWTVAGCTGCTGVNQSCCVPPHSGKNAYDFGAVGTTDTILSQTVADTAGQQLIFEYFVDFNPCGGISEAGCHFHFEASFNGCVEQCCTPCPGVSSNGYVQHDFIVTGTGSDTISFQGRDVNPFIGLDDVSLNTAPEPPLGTILIPLLGLAWCRRRS